MKAATNGRQFPDLFQKALQGSHLADNVTVKYDGDDQRNGPSPPVLDAVDRCGR